MPSPARPTPTPALLRPNRPRPAPGGAAADVAASRTQRTHRTTGAATRRRQPAERPARRSRRGGRSGAAERAARPAAEAEDADAPESGRSATGVVEVLGNGSAFLRVAPPEPSDEDVYISAAQVRRCELVSGDEVTGPVRTPRRSERYPSLVRIDTINGAPADTVSDGSRYEDLPVAWPSERLTFGDADRTLEAIEWLTPLGRGSRAVIVGSRQAGKTETLRRHRRDRARARGDRADARPRRCRAPRRSPSGGGRPSRRPPRSASPPPPRRRPRRSSGRSTPPSGSPLAAATRSC